MKMPYIKFYTRDWRSDDDLQVCTLEAKGAWIEMICIMAQSDNFGYLEKKEKPYDTDSLAKLIHTDKATLNRCIENLENNDVCSRDARGVIYCRRMVGDRQKHDMAVESGKQGGNPKLKKKRTQNPEPRDSLTGGDNPPLKGHKKFIPPTPKEVEEYSKSISYPMQGQAWCDSYAQKDWKVGKNKMKDWKCAVRNWKAQKWLPSARNNDRLGTANGAVI